MARYTCIVYTSCIHFTLLYLTYDIYMYTLSNHMKSCFITLQGNAVVESEADIREAFEKLGAKPPSEGETENYDVYAHY